MICSDKGFICVYFMFSLLTQYSYVGSLDEISVSCTSCLYVLKLVSVSFVRIAEMCSFKAFVYE